VKYLEVLQLQSLQASRDESFAIEDPFFAFFMETVSIEVSQSNILLMFLRYETLPDYTGYLVGYLTLHELQRTLTAECSVKVYVNVEFGAL
jgi:hypothetical protein